ncbi:MAG: SCP2 sterol-binding domain-containing protein [Kangiellaceae bacterium]|nr:SCP2 sterol-binding domain-containing protein [Kangiellaceae bacterium]MCW9016274.1 SCP2 sterol-binding domain-containing protein [Kangiellaceae bacterium]
MSQTNLAIELHQKLTSNISQKVKPRIFNLLTPARIGKLQSLIPMPIKLTSIEFVLNRLLKDPISSGLFDFLDGRVIGIHISDADIYASISAKKNSLHCIHISSEECLQNEANLTINTVDAIKLINQEVDPDTLFFKRRLKISGNTELAHWVKNTIDSIDPEIIPILLRQLLAEYSNSIVKQ